MTGFFAAAFHFRHSVTFPAGCLTKLALDCNRALSVSSQKCHIQTVLYNQSKRDVSFEQADKSKLTASRKTRRFFVTLDKSIHPLLRVAKLSKKAASFDAAFSLSKNFVFRQADLNKNERHP